MRRRFAKYGIGTDIVIAVCFAVLCLFYLWHASHLRSGLMSDVVGPKTFPLMIGTLGFVIAAAFVGRQIVVARRDTPQERLPVMHPPPMMVFLLFAYVALLTPLGYPAATFLYVAAVLRVLGQKGWIGTILFAFCLTAVSFGLFSVVFDIRLPSGFILARLGVL